MHDSSVFFIQFPLSHQLQVDSCDLGKDLSKPLILRNSILRYLFLISRHIVLSLPALLMYDYVASRAMTFSFMASAIRSRTGGIAFEVGTMNHKPQTGDLLKESCPLALQSLYSSPSRFGHS